MGPTARTAFTNADRSWSDEVDSMAVLADVLRAQGIGFEQYADQIDLANGLTLRPQIARIQGNDNGSVGASTTLTISHPVLCPNGTFEYQHSVGGTLKESLTRGFEGWAQTDLPVFLDALDDAPEHCLRLEMEMPDGPVKRQVLLGPPLRAVSTRMARNAEEHEFCACCLFTRSMEAFRELLERDEFFGLRLFAMRSAEGDVQADCRVNGVDWPAGMEALKEYARSWPDCGIEYRKQFALIRTL